MKPRKRFGQHFLRDPNVLNKLLSAIAPRSTDHVVEIGPGQGVLTELLLPAVKRLDAIEIDRDLVTLLEERFSADNNLTIHQADVLKFDLNSIETDNERLRIVGNLPYNISTPLLFKLFSYGNLIQDMIFMLQKEVVDRLTATPGSHDYGRLSVMAQYFCEDSRLFTVGPEAFSPPPKVESAVVCLIPRQHTHSVNDLNLLTTIVREAFSYRRKTLRNCLKKYISAEDLQTLNIDPIKRPQELTVEDFVKISNMVNTTSN
ncbi:16S rRNA (adenine(1518)-N(6)/adenine(1519)-N(6))-dimethyltransferase RsmA [Candidiatus Paracoxiella cheracis]|uniref:16S rRNA (adenine(1518)-N(6)/adenine(1519)-N(6))- dimethyltransferase RsmA n=1 Tax=Candidiatus Paracoxiella cheracis TaxID=3405120 RepID=UPI003BF4FC1E